MVFANSFEIMIFTVALEIAMSLLKSSKSLTTSTLFQLMTCSLGNFAVAAVIDYNCVMKD